MVSGTILNVTGSEKLFSPTLIETGSDFNGNTRGITGNDCLSENEIVRGLVAFGALNEGLGRVSGAALV